MKAIEITQAGGPEVLAMTERPMPEPAHDQVVIKVAYAGVNRPDALQRAGLYNPPKGASDLPGLEAAGEVVAVGAGVSTVGVGDQVCALLPGGGYAEYVATPAAHCLPVPGGLTLAQAACLPENQASRSLLESCGYKYEGVAQSYLQIAGRWRTHVLYANLRGDRRGERSRGQKSRRQCSEFELHFTRIPSADAPKRPRRWLHLLDFQIT